MGTKHTPAPWRVSSESPRIIKKDYRAIGSDAGFLIASTMGRDDSGFYASEQEADANACLIAAAPDLYEALEDALIDFDNWAAHEDNHPHEHLVAWAEKARAAIAKAKGEEQ